MPKTVRHNIYMKWLVHTFANTNCASAKFAQHLGRLAVASKGPAGLMLSPS